MTFSGEGMLKGTGIRRLIFGVCAAAVGASLPRVALAQSADANHLSGPILDLGTHAAASDVTTDATPTPGDAADSANIDSILADAVTTGSVQYSADTSAKPLKSSTTTLDNTALDISRTDNDDGSASISVKKPLATPWDMKIGTDLGLAPVPVITSRPDNPFPGASTDDQQSRTVWASVAVPNIASFTTRVGAAGSDQGMAGATIERSLPLGSRLSLTLQDTCSVTQAFGTPQPYSPLPMASWPEPGTPGPTQIWGNQPQLKLNIVPTGTTLAAGLATATGDPVTHNSLSADQKIYGPLHVTTSVYDVGLPTFAKSITANLKMDF
jgi:hypothetical protein